MIMGKFKNFRYLQDLVGWAVKALARISAVCLVAVMLVFVGNIIFRAFGRPILGTYEVIKLCMVPVIAFAIGYTALMQGHVVIEVVITLFQKRARTIFAVITTGFSMVIWALIAWKSTGFAITQWAMGETTEQLDLPVPLFRIIWAIGVFVLVLVLCVDLVRVLKGQGNR
jgi:TRAP-type C4-dicarboxylate transport system permease small subunit